MPIIGARELRAPVALAEALSLYEQLITIFNSFQGADASSGLVEQQACTWYTEYKQNTHIHKINLTGWWWCTPLIPAFGRQRQADLCDFDAPGLQELVLGQAPKLHRETLPRKYW